MRRNDLQGTGGSTAHRGYEPAEYSWNVEAPADAGAPQTAITAPPDNLSASFSFTGSDNVTLGSSLVFECRLGSEAASGFSYLARNLTPQVQAI